MAGLKAALSGRADDEADLRTLELWSVVATAVLQRSPFARRRVQEDELLIASLRANGDGSTAACVLSAALLPEHEPMLVLHPQTRRGYWIDVDGVADNFQLHTLLAGALIGDPAQGWLPGTPPSPDQLRANSDPQLSPECRVDEGWFNLVNWTGLASLDDPTSYSHWIWNEGRPADITQFEGTRIILLASPPYLRSWSAGRTLPAVPASITVTGHLSPPEYTVWETRLHEASPAQSQP
jgi:hypothetical protein